MTRSGTPHVLRPIVLLLLPLLLVGCVEIRLRLRLLDGGAGQLSMEIRMDLESMARQTAGISAAMGEPPATEQDIQQMVQEMKVKLADGYGAPTLEASQLPTGVSLLDSSTSVEDEVAVTRAVLGFESLDVLRQPVDPQVAAGLGVAVGDGGSLLGGLDVTHKGKVVRVTGDPLGGAEAAMVPDEQLEMMRPLLEGLVVVYELEAPDWKIKANNAYERDGQVLRWLWDLDGLGGDRTIEAKFRR